MAQRTKKYRAPKEMQPRKPGRIGFYSQDIPARAYRLGLLGCSDAEMCLILGIRKKTFELYKRNYPELNEALMRAKAEADAVVADALYKKACGYSHRDLHLTVIDGKVVKTKIRKYYPPDTQAIKFWLINRTGQLDTPWAESKRHEITGKDGGPLQIDLDDSLDLSMLSDDELRVLMKLSPKLAGKIKVKGGDGE